MVDKDLSDQEILDALSFEYYLNKKRTENHKFEVKYNFGKCRICKSQATGIHYGVSSCEACKGFFRRSLCNHKNYVCRGNKDCSIFPKRNKCKYCRWMACLKVGMSLSEVRVGRIPNHMKEVRPKIDTETLRVCKNKFCLSLKHFAKAQRFDGQILPNTFFTEKSLNCSNENQLIFLSLLRDKSYQIFKEQTKVYHDHEKLARKLIDCKQKPKLDISTDHVYELKQKDMLAMKKHAQSMFQIIDELPGFGLLTRLDLQVVLNDGFFTVSIILTICLFIDGDYFLMLDDQTPMTSEVFALLTNENVRNSIFEFFTNLKKLNLTDHEYALLIPLFLSIFSLNKKLEKPQVLRDLGQYYSRALFYEFSLKKRSREFIENFTKVFSCTPEIIKLCKEMVFEN